MADDANRKVIDPLELEIHRLFRERIVQEDALINHRMMWFVLSQAFLVALWGVLFQKLMGVGSDVRFYLLTIAVIGVVFSLGSWTSIRAAQREITELKKKYLELYPIEPPASGSRAERTAISSRSDRRDILLGLTSERFHWMGHIVPFCMPLGLILLWFILVIVAFRYA